MGLKYNGVDKYERVNINYVGMPPTRLRNKENEKQYKIEYSMKIGGLTVTLSEEDAVKLWDDLGSRIEQVNAPDFEEKFLEEMRKNGFYFN